MDNLLYDHLLKPFLFILLIISFVALNLHLFISGMRFSFFRFDSWLRFFFYPHPLIRFTSDSNELFYSFSVVSTNFFSFQPVIQDFLFWNFFSCFFGYSGFQDFSLTFISVSGFDSVLWIRFFVLLFLFQVFPFPKFFILFSGFSFSRKFLFWIWLLKVFLFTKPILCSCFHPVKYLWYFFFIIYSFSGWCLHLILFFWTPEVKIVLVHYSIVICAYSYDFLVFLFCGLIVSVCISGFFLFCFLVTSQIRPAYTGWKRMS